MDIDYQIVKGRVPEARLSGLAALHKEIFGPTISRADLRRRLLRKRSLVCILATSREKLIGYKIGYERNTDEFFSWLGGVKKDFRRRGLASEMMRRQHALVRTLGYRRIVTESGNEWREMIILNLRNDFDIVGSSTDDQGRPKVLMAKNL